jgi:dienelactone hydrolase
LGPRVKAATAFLKEKEPDKKLGVMGFCFGTWLMCKASATGDIDFDCAIGCHPTTILEKAVFGRDEEAMMDALKQPTTILWAGNDMDTYTGEGSNKTRIPRHAPRVGHQGLHL